MEVTVKTKSAGETQKFGEEFAKDLEGGGVVFLYGELGAGKTTFVQGLARGLGIKKRIVSPTFILARWYPLPRGNFFWHVDLYRLTDPREIEGLGLPEIAKEKNNIMVVEWPEKIAGLLMGEHWEMKFRQISELEREIKYEIVS